MSEDFILEIPTEESIKEEVEKVTAVTSVVREKVISSANKNVDSILNINLDSLTAKKNVLNTIDNFGLTAMKKCNAKSQLLQKPIGELSKRGGESGEIAMTLATLGEEVRELNPHGIDFLAKGKFGKVAKPIIAYFNKYKRADQVIAGIIQEIDRGETMLTDDNTALMIHQNELMTLVKQLNIEIELGLELDRSIQAALDERGIAETDPVKYKFIREEVIFPLNQNLMDMRQVLAVSQQGIISTDMVIRTNKELIRGCRRAKFVTITAIKNAVQVANALYNQRIVIDQLDKLNSATETMISQVSTMLKEQSVEVYKKSSQAVLSPEVLQESFDTMLEAVNEIENFKENSIQGMRETVHNFGLAQAKGNEVIEKMEKSRG